VTEKGEINLSSYKGLYKQIRKYANPSKKNQWLFDTDDSVINKYADILFLFSFHLHQSSLPEIKNLSQIKPRMHCIGAIYKEKKGTRLEVCKAFRKPLSELLNETLGFLEGEIFYKLLSILQLEGIAIGSNGVFEILQKCSQQNLDMPQLSSYLNTWTVKVYMHLYQFKQVAIFLESFFSSLPPLNIIENHPKTLEFGSIPGDHVFIRLIEGFKSVSAPLELENDYSGPKVFNETLLLPFSLIF
jgi:hypothetical protein